MSTILVKNIAGSVPDSTGGLERAFFARKTSPRSYAAATRIKDVVQISEMFITPFNDPSYKSIFMVFVFVATLLTASLYLSAFCFTISFLNFLHSFRIQVRFIAFRKVGKAILNVQGMAECNQLIPGGNRIRVLPFINDLGADLRSLLQEDTAQFRTLNPKVAGSIPPRRTKCTNGGTGIRARLRTWCPHRACEFESHFVHHTAGWQTGNATAS